MADCVEQAWLAGGEGVGRRPRLQERDEERVRRLTLTTRGRARLDASAAPVQRLEDLLAGHAGPEHTGTVVAWLRVCADDLDDLPAPPDSGTAS